MVKLIKKKLEKVKLTKKKKQEYAVIKVKLKNWEDKNEKNSK